MRLQFTDNSNYRNGFRVAITGISTTISLIVIMASLSFSPLLISAYAQSILDGMTPQERHEELKRLHQLQQQRLQQQPPTSPSPQPQQPTQTAPPLTGSPSTTPSTPPTSGVIIDRPTAARLAAEDPYFAQFEKVLDMCMGKTLSGEVTMTASQCAASMQQGADRWCGIEFFDGLKCEYATKMVTEFNKIAGILGRFGQEEIPSLDELFPGEPNLFAPTP